MAHFWNIFSASPETSQQSAQLHHEVITLFDRELVLEILLVIGQEMELRENSNYNLLIMELLHHLLKSQDPAAVARAESHCSSLAKAEKVQNSLRNPATSSLAAKLKHEKTKLQMLAGARHAHFGGTWMKHDNGKRSYFGANQKAGPPSAPKRKNRKAEPFIGSGRTIEAHSKIPSLDQGPAAKRAQRTLNSFCERFVQQCYGPVMKSLKNEFRRDSVRLEESDKVIFFRIVWFFCQWRRLSRRKTNEGLGQLIFTMDVFAFNLVLNATDTFYQHKNYTRQAQAVALYSEMMHLLYEMYTSKDSTENMMALGLMDRLFYGNEPLDRLPKLLSRWAPGTSTREYLCDLTELCHVSLKLLDSNARSCREFKERNQRSNDALSKKKLAAADFDVDSYFVRKIVSNQVVSMYTHLLSQYNLNAAHVNHRIVSFFLRLSRVTISSSDSSDSDLPQNLLATKTVTLEPILYNIQLILVIERILNDADMQKDNEQAFLLTFCANLITKFATASVANPMLYVDCLFRHTPPHKYCDLVTNFYVTEELRLIAEHDLLLEDQRRNNDARTVQDDGEKGIDDGELEFTDGVGHGDRALARTSPAPAENDGEDEMMEFAADGANTYFSKVDETQELNDESIKLTIKNVDCTVDKENLGGDDVNFISSVAVNSEQQNELTGNIRSKMVGVYDSEGQWADLKESRRASDGLYRSLSGDEARVPKRKREDEPINVHR